MKNIKYIINALIAGLLFASGILQTKAASAALDGQFVVTTNDGTHFTVKVQIKTSTAGIKLGTSTLIFNFDNTNLSLPNNPSTSDYTFYGYSGGGYNTATVTQPVPGRVSINVDMNTAGALVPSSYTDLVSIKFTTLNPAATGGAMTWNNSVTGSVMDDVFQDDQVTNFTQGSFSNLLPSALPVVLTSFSAVLRDNATQLNWTTSSEINNDYFSVERSADGRLFEDIQHVAGNGNSQVVRNYNATDETPLPGVSYYRLKQVDFNGTFAYSKVVAVNNTKATPDFELLSVSPTSFDVQTVLTYNATERGSAMLTVYSLNGDVVYKDVLSAEKGRNQYNIQDAAGWKSGEYIARVTHDGQASYIRMIKL
jgi:hypothetical protein